MVINMIHVAAAIIHRGPRILICQRGEGGNCSNLWEFPGGKVEPNETPEQCVLRECREELGIEIELKGLYARTKYRYPDREIAFSFFRAELTNGEIKRKVHRDIKWVLPDELKSYEFCPADIEIVNRLAMEE